MAVLSSLSKNYASALNPMSEPIINLAALEPLFAPHGEGETCAAPWRSWL
jgi:hypothetical protein